MDFPIPIPKIWTPEWIKLAPGFHSDLLEMFIWYNTINHRILKVPVVTEGILKNVEFL